MDKLVREGNKGQTKIHPPTETEVCMADEEELKRLLSLTTKRTFKDYQRIAILSNRLGYHPNRDWDDNDTAEIEALLAHGCFEI